MKNIFTLIIGLFLCAGLMHAQTDTLYVVKAGVVIEKQSIKFADVDSVIFYNPVIASTNTQATQNFMNVKTTSGTQTSYELSNIRKLTFPSTGNMTIKTTSGTEDYALENVCYLRFASVGTGIDNTTSSISNLYLYPNPVVDVVNIQLSLTGSQVATVELLSIEGLILYKAQVNSESIFQINVSQFQHGVYFCRVNHAGNIETTKFLKK